MATEFSTAENSSGQTYKTCEDLCRLNGIVRGKVLRTIVKAFGENIAQFSSHNRLIEAAKGLTSALRKFQPVCLPVTYGKVNLLLNP